MTATTTIRIDDELKARIAEAASRAGQTAHAFMLDAIAQTVEQAEHEAAFHQIADDRWAQHAETGKTVAWEDARIWLEARARGEQPARPTARAHKN
jgi:predicted transcriptional regulator